MPPKRLNIPESRLRALYLQKRFSTDAIAKIFHCDHVTILNYLIRYGIPRRSKLGNRKPVCISKEIIFDLYCNKKLTQKQIAEKFAHSRYGIQRIMKKYRIASRTLSVALTKYPKFDFSGNLVDKAYLIGFRLGDLNVFKTHELIQVRCSTTIEAQIKLIEKLFKQYSNVHIWKAKRGTFEIVVLLNKSFNFLLPKQDKIEDWIVDRTEYFLAFLAGYADAEGSYYLRKPRANIGKVGWGMFEIQTYDKNILWMIFTLLKRYNIESNFTLSRRGGYIDRRGIRTNKDCWRIVINKKQSLWNFIKLIAPYHRHNNKIHSMQSVKDNLQRRNYLPYCKPITL
jgi:hypothetical protein